VIGKFQSRISELVGDLNNPNPEWYSEERPIPSFTTPFFMIDVNKIEVGEVPINMLAFYQKRMSKATWRPGSGRKMGWFVMHEQYLLGIIALTSPVIRIKVRDDYLFPNAPSDFDYGNALRNYMDMSVCVATQPIGWHWNIGKLLAMLATTLWPDVEARYGDELKGIITTDYWGRKPCMYTGVYKFLGYTGGDGSEHVSDAEYKKMVKYLRKRDALPSCNWEAGSNARMRRIAAYQKLTGQKVDMHHGHQRGVYYHDTIKSEQAVTV
jgi:hypothetical protein